ncbi:L,D-transpeptidase family protein [Sphingomicrobium flavum]|uniref:L,D-transpeptidase family protein n=1 Tax=Sphingomicrobium flavum TaxID=1229164 RepID=UPI0021AD5325|nr:L,D-transpeptidase family protein [Sphingomicrobium flavum]
MKLISFKQFASAIALAGASGALAAQPVTGDAPEAHVAPHAAPGQQEIAVMDDPLAAEAPRALVWQEADVEALSAFIDGVAAEGLDPADYDPEGLRSAIASGDTNAISEAATERFNTLSSDLALGHVRGKARVDWHIEDPDLNQDRQRALLEWALYHGSITKVLNELLPQHPQYQSLKTALAKADPADSDTIAAIRLNMDRWRWLPADLGDRYIIVNVPAYTAALVENGETTSRHRAVAGAVKTPTPQLMAKATGVTFNPYWYVPKSIEPEVRGKAGFEAVKDEDGSIKYWRQPPGPNNSLGRVKFTMYNEHLIYLHDTNARSLFNAEERARSHGCIRTENILGLATMLLGQGDTGWDAAKTVEVLNSGKETPASFAEPLPVYIVYFSVAAATDGRIVNYDDIYSRDKPVRQALGDWPVKGQKVREAKAGEILKPAA